MKPRLKNLSSTRATLCVLLVLSLSGLFARAMLLQAPMLPQKMFTALADLTNKRTAAIIEKASKQKAPTGSGARG